jgi:short-subunit dehydrogenase
MLKDAMFTQKVIIITGASQGIGFALAMALKPYRPKLVIAARNVEDLQKLKQQLNFGGHVEHCRIDRSAHLYSLCCE